jgi:hypothetical protein
MLSSPAGLTTVIAYFTVSLESKYLNYSVLRMPLQDSVVMAVPKYSHITPVPGLSLLGKFPQNGEIGGFLGSDLGNRIFGGNFWGIF